jgi:hypothetical protein
MLFRPILPLARNFKRKDLHIARYLPLFPQPAFAEQTDTSLTDGTVHSGFFISFGGRRLLRCLAVDGPTFGHGPAALLPRRDQQDFDVAVPHPIGKSRELLELHRSTPKAKKLWMTIMVPVKYKRGLSPYSPDVEPS